jgi:hypothetical protein
MNILVTSLALLSLTANIDGQVFGRSPEALVLVESQETIVGVVIEPGVVCPRLQLDDGRRISLMGVERSLAPGQRLSLEGQWAVRSTCQQGPTFQATRFEVLRQ